MVHVSTARKDGDRYAYCEGIDDGRPMVEGLSR